MQLTNLNKNAFNIILKKMNTMSLQQTSKTSKQLKQNTQIELKKRKNAAKVIQNKYIDLKIKKIKKIKKMLKNGMNIVDEYIALQTFPNNIKNDLLEFLVQYPLTYKEEILIIKELIQYLLDITLEPQKARNRKMKTRINYVMKTPIIKGEYDLQEYEHTYKRFYAN